MRRRRFVVVLLGCLMPVLAGAAGHMTAQAASGPEAAYVVLLRLRWDLYARWKETGTWPNDSAANAALAGHNRHWDAEREAGRIILAGGMKGEYWDNVALIIFRAASPAQADSLMRADPAVRAHVFQAQVRPFDVHLVEGSNPTTRR